MNINEINTIYNIYEHNKIKLFGHYFAERNKNNSKIIIDGKEDELKEFKTLSFSFLRKKININKLEIKLKEMINVSNISSMLN